MSQHAYFIDARGNFAPRNGSALHLYTVWPSAPDRPRSPHHRKTPAADVYPLPLCTTAYTAMTYHLLIQACRESTKSFPICHIGLCPSQGSQAGART